MAIHAAGVGARQAARHVERVDRHVEQQRVGHPPAKAMAARSEEEIAVEGRQRAELWEPDSWDAEASFVEFIRTALPRDEWPSWAAE